MTSWSAWNLPSRKDTQRAEPHGDGNGLRTGSNCYAMSLSRPMSIPQIIGKETPQALLDEIARIAPYKAWLGIKWLCTYISIRPGELKDPGAGY